MSQDQIRRLVVCRVLLYIENVGYDLILIKYSGKNERNRKSMSQSYANGLNAEGFSRSHRR